MVNLDDKDIAIIALTVIALAVILKLKDPQTVQSVIIAIISAIAGFVTGRKMGE